MIEQIPQAAKTSGDLLSFGLIGGTLAGWLPAMAAFVSIIWGLIRIYETRTIQRMCGKARIKRTRTGEPDAKSEDHS